MRDWWTIKNMEMHHEKVQFNKAKVYTFVPNHNFPTLVENPPFCNCIFNYCSITNIVENDKNSCKLFFATGKCFSQLQTSKVDKYKSRMSIQSKVYATCQHHNNNHCVPLLTNLIENCSTDIVEGCCELHATNG
jgi:hypothetical protein